VPRTATPVPTDPEEARKAAYAAALRLLAGREMSAARVRDRLLSRGFPQEAVEHTVQRLTGAGLLDDRRAAQAAARTLVTVRQRGRHRVGRELEKLGFSRELAQEVMLSVLADADERAVLDKVVASKLHGRRPIPDPAAYRRLFGALLRRGFPADLIRAALRPYWGSRHEPEDQ
jgi:regulatory protein